jgi:hypothetical protein
MPSLVYIDSKNYNALPGNANAPDDGLAAGGKSLRGPVTWRSIVLYNPALI